MRRFLTSSIIAVACCCAGGLPTLAGTWQIPIVEEPADIDHIQIRLGDAYTFNSQAFFNFFAVDEHGNFDFNGLLWSQQFINDNRTFAAATGPSIGAGTLAYTLQVDGDTAVDRPAFHYQTYLGSSRVSNFDIYCVGPNHDDWVIYAGTWNQNAPVPPFQPGDGDRDADVDIFDIINHWQIGYTGPGATGSTWEDGDWNGDGAVDIFDVVNAWQLNYTGPVTGPPPLASRQDSPLDFSPASIPEPATGLLMLGLSAAAALRRRRTS